MSHVLAGIVLLFLGVAAEAGTNVKLTVEEPSGVQRMAWPVTSGIPMAQGALEDDNAAALFDSAGQQVPLQTEVRLFQVDETQYLRGDEPVAAGERSAGRLQAPTTAAWPWVYGSSGRTGQNQSAPSRAASP